MGKQSSEPGTGPENAVRQDEHLLLPFPSPEYWSSSRLPQPPTSLIGRESEIETLANLILSSGIRLVTLLGPGGVGKTRLAIATAQRLQRRFSNNLWFVDLSPLSDVTEVPAAISRGLGLRSQSTESQIGHIQSYFEGQESLLLLDNFEGVDEAALFVASILSESPSLKIMVTSRAALHLSGEQRFPVRPLALPEAGARQTVESLGTVESIHLFVARAQLVQPDFAIDGQNAAEVTAVCQRLEGLPLAIELAAARLSVLSLPSLVDRLGGGLDVLAGGPTDQPARQQTIANTINWSYQFLTSDLRAMLRCLAIFEGGFSLAAAETVLATIAEDTREADRGSLAVLDGIAALVDASLLQMHNDPWRQARYTMLQTVREFCLDLVAPAEERKLRDAHAAYWINRGKWFDPNQFDAGETFEGRLRKIDAEDANLRTALLHLKTTGNAEAGLRLAGSLATYWHHRSYLGEGRRWLEWALANTPDDGNLTRGWALAGLSLVLWTQGVPDGSNSFAKTAMPIAERYEDRELQGFSWHMQALADYVRRDLVSASDSMSQALVVWRETGLQANTAMALMILSHVAIESDAEAADALASEALAIFQAVGHPSGSALATIQLAHFALRRGDDANAVRGLQEAIRLWASIEERWAVPLALIPLASIAMRYNQVETALKLLGVARGLMHLAEGNFMPTYLREMAEIENAAHQALDEQRCAELYTCGFGTSLNDAVGLADSVDVTAEVATHLASRLTIGGLTERETEIVRFLVGGHTDREIGEALFISQRTVNSHVASILAKLNLTNRREAANWGRRNLSGDIS